MTKQFDCAIIGGGVVGLSLALLLTQLKYRVVLIERASPNPKNISLFEARTLALSHASVCIYQTLDVWQTLQNTAPLKQVWTTVKGQYGSCRINHQDLNVAALGYVVGAADLETALYEKLSETDTLILRPAQILTHEKEKTTWQLTVKEDNHEHHLQARLLVAADGMHSSLRAAHNIGYDQSQYNHYAVMANVRFAATSPHVAIERFLPKGAIALLPWVKDIATCILTTSEGEAKALMTLSEDQFMAACQEKLGYQGGRLFSIGKRHSLPLTMVVAKRQIASRFLLLGNAAHSLHPIAAQGLNLSLRDIWQIRKQVLEYEAPCDLGNDKFLEHYVKARLADQRRVIFATDKIARFMSGGPLPASLRSLGMTLFDCMVPLKQTFSRLSMGL